MAPARNGARLTTPGGGRRPDCRSGRDRCRSRGVALAVGTGPGDDLPVRDCLPSRQRHGPVRRSHRRHHPARFECHGVRVGLWQPVGRRPDRPPAAHQSGRRIGRGLDRARRRRLRPDRAGRDVALAGDLRCGRDDRVRGDNPYRSRRECCRERLRRRSRRRDRGQRDERPDLVHLRRRAGSHHGRRCRHR